MTENLQQLLLDHTYDKIVLLYNAGKLLLTNGEVNYLLICGYDIYSTVN